MAKQKRQQSANTAVGYCRPPKARQFKKGKSGNPRGRPKGSRNIGKMLLDVTGQKIAVTEKGKRRLMPALEVTLRQLMKEAMKNNQGAIKILLSLMDRHIDPSDVTTAPRAEEILAEDKTIYDRYFGRCSEAASKSVENSENGDQ